MTASIWAGRGSPHRILVLSASGGRRSCQENRAARDNCEDLTYMLKMVFHKILEVSHVTNHIYLKSFDSSSNLLLSSA